MCGGSGLSLPLTLPLPFFIALCAVAFAFCSVAFALCATEFALCALAFVLHAVAFALCVAWFLFVLQCFQCHHAMALHIKSQCCMSSCSIVHCAVVLCIMPQPCASFQGHCTSFWGVAHHSRAWHTILGCCAL